MKININKYLIIGGVAATTFLGSCKKSFLELKPYTDIPVADAVSTESNMQSAINGTYQGLVSTNLYGRTIPIFGDLLADNIFISVVNSGRYTSEKSYSIVVNDADVSGLWTDSYNDILRANNIIDATLATAGANQIKGQAYAMRALNYFNLVRFFAKPYTDDPNSAGVPLVLHYNPTLLPARNTVAEVYTQILSDLEQAYTLAPAYSNSAAMSKYAARALEAKVNLTKGDYQKALDQANDVISNGGFTLISASALPAYWANQASTTSKVETLFEVASTSVTNNSYDELVNIYAQGSTYGDALATKDLYNSYDTTDVRKSLILDSARAKTGGEDPAYVVNKYSNAAGNYGTKKVIRLADVYLIAAEAANRLGNDATALTRLNALMAQRDPSKVYASSGTQLLSDIITERRKELAFEGDRFHDLNRLKQDIVRGPEYPTGTIKYGDTRRVLPIPQGELNVNPNIKQNPGY